MGWLAVGANAVIGVAYLCIAWLIAERLFRARQGVRSNPLAVATACIFFSCGTGHGFHALHALHAVTTHTTSDLMSPHMVWWDTSTAAVAVWYWTLRGWFGSLIGGGSLYEQRDAAIARQLSQTLELVQDGLLLFEVIRDDDRSVRDLVLRSLNSAGRAVTAQDGAAQDRAAQDRAAQDRAAQDRAAQDRAAQDRAAQDRAAQDRAAQDRAAEVVDRSYHQLASPQLPLAMLGQLLELAERGGRWQQEIGWEKPGGGQGTAELTADSDGQRVLVMWHETSDRTLRERDRQRLERDLDATYDAAPIGMAVVGVDGRIIRANNALLRILGGLSEEQLKGRSLLELVHEGDQQHHVEATERLLLEPTSRLDVEERLTEVNGSARWVRCVMAAVLEDGQPRHLVAQFQDISERKRYEAQLRHLADHDPLTGLLNRRGFDEALRRHTESVRRYGARGALLMLDLDHFKEVNDTLGHPAGDQLIVSVADLLRAATRDTDLVGRLGGDEFAVLIPEEGQAAAVQLANRICEVIRNRTALLDGEHAGTVTASIGIKVITAGDTDPQALLVDGDLSLYDAKQGGRDQWALYTSDAHGQPRTKSQLMWLERVRTALAGDGFLLAAQPIHDVARGRAGHHELLLRLKGEAGPVLPAHFLYIIEQHGLMQEVDRWVVDQAIALLQRNRFDVLCVNISARSLSDRMLIDHITGALAGSGVHPGRLVIEITETAAVANITAARAFITQLRTLGCEVALDDFGAGFGSFYYLKHLPFDYLKIDGEFVNACLSSPVDRLVISSVLTLARGLNKKVIAEYVADAATQTYLAGEGVNYLQGFHIGRPEILDLPALLGTGAATALIPLARPATHDEPAALRRG